LKEGLNPTKNIFSKWPIDIPSDYLLSVNQDQSINEEKLIESSIIKSNPYGDIDWVRKVVKNYGRTFFCGKIEKGQKLK